MGKGLKYGEFEFPNSGVTHVRAYARGGKVAQAKVSKVMHEFGEGKLHSGSKSGPVVKNRQQAIAIGISEGKKASKGKYAEGGMVNLPPKPNIKPNLVDIKPKPVDIRPKLGPQSDRDAKGYAGGGAVPGGGVGGSGKLLGELMGQPKKNEIGVNSRKYADGGIVERSRMAMPKEEVERRKQTYGQVGPVKAYAKGGMVGKAKPAPTMKPRMTGPRGGKEGKMAKASGTDNMGALNSLSTSMPMMKVGGSVGKKASLSPKMNTNLPPRSVNVKARMSAGIGDIENLRCGGKVKKYAQGGMVHPDVKEDKSLIKRAVGMHDTQLHGGERTNLAKLKRGGRV